MKPRSFAALIILLITATALFSGFNTKSPTVACYLKEETLEFGGRKVYTLTLSHKVVSVTEYDTTGHENSRIDYSYNVSGNINRITAYYQQQLRSVTEFSYQDKRISDATLSLMEGKGLKPRTRADYTYNAEGRISRVVTYAGTFLKMPLFLDDFEYDKKGNLTKLTEYFFDKGNFAVSRKLKGTALLEATRTLDKITEYSYDDKIHPLSDYHLPDIEKKSTTVNNILTEVQKYADGKVKKDKSYKYEYNSNNLPVSRTTHYSSGVIKGPVTFKYDCE